MRKQCPDTENDVSGQKCARGLSPPATILPRPDGIHAASMRVFAGLMTRTGLQVTLAARAKTSRVRGASIP